MDCRKTSSTARRVAVEAVLTGRVPGLPEWAGAWGVQYAWALARALGPVSLLRIGSDQASLSIIDPSAGAPAGGRGASEDLTEALRRACGQGGRPVSRILLDVEDPEAGFGAQVAAEAEGWTVLSGADAASVAGSFSLIKRLVRAPGAGRPRRTGVMVVGADPGPAAAAHGMLDTIVRPLAGRVNLVGVQKRAVPVMIETVASSVLDDAAWQRCRGILFPRRPDRLARLSPRTAGCDDTPLAEPVGATAA